MSRARIEARIHPTRPPRSLERAAQTGGLDPDAVRCVLAAAGQQVTKARPPRPAQLTERELDVLRLIARGHSIKR